MQAISLRDDDELIEVKLDQPQEGYFPGDKAYGQCIRFPESDVRPTGLGRTAMGVIGMQLTYDGDEVVGMQLDTQGDHLLLVSAVRHG